MRLTQPYCRNAVFSLQKNKPLWSITHNSYTERLEPVQIGLSLVYYTTYGNPVTTSLVAREVLRGKVVYRRHYPNMELSPINFKLIRLKGWEYLILIIPWMPQNPLEKYRGGPGEFAIIDGASGNIVQTLKLKKPYHDESFSVLIKPNCATFAISFSARNSFIHTYIYSQTPDGAFYRDSIIAVRRSDYHSYTFDPFTLRGYMAASGLGACTVTFSKHHKDDAPLEPGPVIEAFDIAMESTITLPLKDGGRKRLPCEHEKRPPGFYCTKVVITGLEGMNVAFFKTD